MSVRPSIWDRLCVSGECVRRWGVKWPNLWDLFVFERFGVSVPMAWGRSQRPANPGSPAAPPEPRGLLGGPSRLGVGRTRGTEAVA